MLQLVTGSSHSSRAWQGTVIGSFLLTNTPTLQTPRQQEQSKNKAFPLPRPLLLLVYGLSLESCEGGHLCLEALWDLLGHPHPAF